jgi:hypothetical protein
LDFLNLCQNLIKKWEEEQKEMPNEWKKKPKSILVELNRWLGLKLKCEVASNIKYLTELLERQVVAAI